LVLERNLHSNFFNKYRHYDNKAECPYYGGNCITEVAFIKALNFPGPSELFIMSRCFYYRGVCITNVEFIQVLGFLGASDIVGVEMSILLSVFEIVV